MIIGLCGKKNAGKDTAAKYLVDEYGYTRISFADKLKESVAALFGISREKVDEWKERGEYADNMVVLQMEWFDSSDRNPDPALVPAYSKNINWREFLQRYGTEAHRNIFGGNFWVDQVLPIFGERSPSYGVMSNEDLVVSDVRFPNEAARVKYYKGFVVEIRRPALAEEDEHISEAQEFEKDFSLVNEEDNLEYLYGGLDNLMGQIATTRR